MKTHPNVGERDVRMGILPGGYFDLLHTGSRQEQGYRTVLTTEGDREAPGKASRLRRIEGRADDAGGSRGQGAAAGA